MALPFNPFEKKQKKYTKVKLYEKADFEQKETISNDTVLNDIETVSSDIKTVSINTVLNFDTVSDTVSNQKKMKPSLLEMLILKQMVNRLENEISTFQTLQISKATGTTLGGARNALNRLKAKGLIENCGFQKGNKIGSTSFKINPKVHEYLRLLNGQKETISNDTVSINTVSETVSHYSKKEEEILLTEELKKIGVKNFHLKNFQGTQDELIELIQNFTHSMVFGEIKNPNKLSLFLSLIRDKKQWVSESYLKQLQADLDHNTKRILAMENLKKQELENKLIEKYQTFLKENPNFEDEVRLKHKNLNINITPEVVSKIAFEEFKSKL